MEALEFDSFTDFYGVSEYSDFEQEHRCAGSFDLNVLDVQQEAIESVDPAIAEYPIALCNSGGGAAEIDFGDGWMRRSLRPGFVDVQPANQECRFRIPAVHLTIIFVKQPQLVRCLEDTSFSHQDICLDSGSFQTNLAAAELVRKIWSSSQINDPARNLIVDGLFLQLVAHLIPNKKPHSLLSSMKCMGDIRMQRVSEFVEDNISDPLSLQTLAGVACMSVSHFSRSFRKTAGVPVWKYVQQRRCARAYELLVHTNLPIIVIAAQCGFSSQAYFTTVFKREFQITPGAFRR